MTGLERVNLTSSSVVEKPPSLRASPPQEPIRIPAHDELVTLFRAAKKGPPFVVALFAILTVLRHVWKQLKKECISSDARITFASHIINLGCLLFYKGFDYFTDAMAHIA